jgi:hypothetical protein
MPQKNPLEIIAGWFRILGVDFIGVAQRAGNDTPKLIQAFDDCRKIAKANFKKMAFETHPDRAPPGREREYEARFKELSNVWGRLKSIEMKLKPRRRQVFTTVTVYTGSTTSSTTTTVVW